MIILDGKKTSADIKDEIASEVKSIKLKKRTVKDEIIEVEVDSDN